MLRGMSDKFRGMVIGSAFTVMLLAAYWAGADQRFMSPTFVAQATQACVMEGATTQTVSVTGTTALTTNLTGQGTVRVVCTQDAHMVQGIQGAVGATATTSDMLIPMFSPEYFYSRGSKFAFIRDSQSGTCYVTECN